MKYSWLLGLFLGSLTAAAQAVDVSFQHVRNATAKISFGETTFLIDPMLAPKGQYPGFKGTYNDELRNPLTDLPMSTEQTLAGVDAVMLTHTHADHWDQIAQQTVPKDMPIFVQHAQDAQAVREQGFTKVEILKDGTRFANVELFRTGGQHGTDLLYAMPQMKQMLGEAMGIVFKYDGAPTIYVAGDTIWRPEVDQALSKFSPDVIVLNTGAAKIQGFADNPILMGKEDTLVAAQKAPKATIIAVHMDAVNHMTVSREQLREFIAQHQLTEQVVIPDDGQTLTW